ncbi:MAG: hypothetical protein WAT39_13885 [Planctomycetota bacterium]
MTNLPLSFTLPFVTLLGAAFAPAQITAANTNEMPRQTAVQLAMPACDFGLFLLAVSDRRLRIVKADLLVDAIPVFASANGSQLVADLALPDSDLKFWWQGISADGTSLRIGAIQSVDTTAMRKPMATQAPVKADMAPVQAPVKADQPTADKNTNQDGDRQPRASDLPITLEPIRSGQYLRELHASFTAPTDGYALRLLEVVGQPGGTLDVYLYRKLPGAGEGRREVVEEHRVEVQVRATRLRVFLGEGTEPRPSEDVTWRRLAVLPQ